MAQPGWYNQNQYRDWPFLNRVDEGSAGAHLATWDRLPHEVFVDAGCLIGPETTWENRTDYAYLAKIARTGNQFTFTFATTATTRLLTAVRTIGDDKEWATEWIPEWDTGDDSPSGSSSESLETSSESSPSEQSSQAGSEAAVSCNTEPEWRLFVVHGRLDDLAEQLADGESIEFASTAWVLEPSRVQALSYVTAFSLANYPRTLATPDEECEADWGAQPVYVAAATCITGDVRLQEGWNCSIRQDTAKNTITIGALAGGGEGQPCQEVPISDDETSPDDGRYLSGGPTCDSLVATINGKGGRNLVLEPGPGIRITTDPDNENTIIVGLDLAYALYCLTD